MLIHSQALDNLTRGHELLKARCSNDLRSGNFFRAKYSGRPLGNRSPTNRSRINLRATSSTLPARTISFGVFSSSEPFVIYPRREALTASANSQFGREDSGNVR
jgi:hypothetical protein